MVVLKLRGGEALFFVCLCCSLAAGILPVYSVAFG